LPDLDRERFHYVGNSSLHGAYLILLSGRNKDLVNEISEKMTYIGIEHRTSIHERIYSLIILAAYRYESFSFCSTGTQSLIPSGFIESGNVSVLIVNKPQ